MQSKYFLVFQDAIVTRYYGLEPFDSMEQVGAVVFIENAAFQSEGILRGYMYQNGQPHDTRVYSILNEDVDETL